MDNHKINKVQELLRDNPKIQISNTEMMAKIKE